MAVLLISHRFHSEHGAELLARIETRGYPLELVVLPKDSEARLAEDQCARLQLAFFSGDVFPAYSRQFFSAVRKAPALEWLHVFNAGVDHPIYNEMLERGVKLTTSSGSTAEPIAHTAIAGILMLARNFPRWLAAQREREWDPMRGNDVPRDLPGQTVVILGLGHIGNEIARLARVLGMRVIGVRRSARRAGDHVDELYAPEALPELLPRADWLVVACPLTRETRKRVDAALLARLPRGARLVNVARGEIVDEAALIESLRAGRLAGAYLDVFEREPLPADSPLWDLPNVIVTPHNSPAASGNEARVYRIFLENLERWHRGEALVNQVRAEDKI